MKGKRRLQGLWMMHQKGATIIPINPNKKDWFPKMQPYILTNVTDEMTVMEEILVPFFRLLHIVKWMTIAYVNKGDRPLALYYLIIKHRSIRDVLQSTAVGYV